MFELSLVELAVIALVALLVLGPERLPRAARTVGMYARRARQSWSAVRADIERELAADELRRSMQDHVDAATRSARALRDELNPAPDRGDRLDGPLARQRPPQQTDADVPVPELPVQEPHADPSGPRPQPPTPDDTHGSNGAHAGNETHGRIDEPPAR